MSEELTITIMLRGQDPGVYFNSTTGFGGVSSIGSDIGLSYGRGYYLGQDASKLSSDALGGWQISAAAGGEAKLGIGGGISRGVDIGLNNQVPTTITDKISISIGVGVATPVQVSAGAGSATPAVPIIKF